MNADMTSMRGRHVLVLGAGESGQAMARWCAGQGARVRVADSRAAPPGAEALHQALPRAERVFGPFDMALLDGVDTVAVSPGIDSREAVIQSALARGMAVVGEMGLFAQALDVLKLRDTTRVVAITGTNGKTTTTALTAALCRGAGIDAAAAGNISPAALAALMACLDGERPLPACWVLELSSFQLEFDAALQAAAAVVLNVTEDHLDRHGDLQAYADVKARIFAGDGVQVLNRQDDLVMAMATPGRRVVTIGTDVPPGPTDFGLLSDGAGVWLARGTQRLLRIDTLKLAGMHNVVNAMAALALASQLSDDMPALLAALQAFKGLPHRVEAIARRRDDVVYYDDSKGTNVGATQAALAGLGRKVVLIAGGDGKGQDFSVLRDAVARHVAAVVLIGRDAARIDAALQGLEVIVRHAGDMAEAVAVADQLAQAGQLVLLSPACASLDMFRNYVHRAEVFREAVLRLPAVEAL